MSYQNVSITGDFSIVSALTFGYAIFQKHWNTIKLHAVNLNSGVGKLMHIVRKSVDICIIEAGVMVAADKDFVSVWQVTKPVEEIKGFPCSVPTMQKSPECTTTSASGKSRSR